MNKHQSLSWTVAVLGLALVLHIWLPIIEGQEAPPIRRPTGRVGGPTMTPTNTPTATETPTVTPTPDPCSECPDPTSLSCTIAWNACVQCWADCGQPIATPTPTQPPTPTRTPTPADPCAECPDPDSFTCTIAWSTCVRCWEDCGQPIATPTPTPTPTPGFCEPPQVIGVLRLEAIYAHEDPDNPGQRYMAVDTVTLGPGQRAGIGAYEGSPIGFEWYHDGALVKSCGDTGGVFPPIFADGFESGDTGRWR